MSCSEATSAAIRSRVSASMDVAAETERLVDAVSILTTAISGVPGAIRKGCKRGRTMGCAVVVSELELREGRSIVLARKATPMRWSVRKRKSSGRSQAQRVMSGKLLVRAWAKPGYVCEWMANVTLARAAAAM